MDSCPKCNKKQYYYRAAFGSWRCYSCGYEEINKNKEGTADHIQAVTWWNYLSPTKKVEIYRQMCKTNETINE